jgi:hypothetical protein
MLRSSSKFALDRKRTFEVDYAEGPHWVESDWSLAQALRRSEEEFGFFRGQKARDGLTKAIHVSREISASPKLAASG